MVDTPRTDGHNPILNQLGPRSGPEWRETSAFKEEFVFVFGGMPERLKGTDCKSVGYAYVGSNPTPSTIDFVGGFSGETKMIGDGFQGRMVFRLGCKEPDRQATAEWVLEKKEKAGVAQR